MTKFKWYDAFSFDYATDRYQQETLRRYINKYGVNAIDNAGRSIFITIYAFEIYDDDIISIVFEYKPNLLSLCYDSIDSYPTLVNHFNRGITFFELMKYELRHELSDK